MCDYTQVEYACGHLRFTVRAWCELWNSCIHILESLMLIDPFLQASSIRNLTSDVPQMSSPSSTD
jgi:hypothetical protein